MDDKNNLELKKTDQNTQSNSLSKEIIADKKKSDRKNTKIKSWVVLVFINLLMFGVSIFFIVSLPKKAGELNKARSDEQKVKESKEIDVTGLENNLTKESVDGLAKYYPEESGLIDFIELVEEMRENGLVKNFSLVGQDAVKDKTGAYGIPIIIEFEGSWESINVSLQALQKLPYLIRAINVEAKVVDEQIVNFKYGGFLYVSDKLAKAR